MAACGDDATETAADPEVSSPLELASPTVINDIMYVAMISLLTMHNNYSM